MQPLGVSPAEPVPLGATERVVKAYVAAVKRGRFCVIGVWLIIFICGALWGPPLMDETSQDFKPTPGSKAEQAAKLFGENFRAQQQEETELLLIEAKEDLGHDPLLGNITEYTTRKLASAQPPLTVTGYTTLQEQNLSLLASSFLSADNRSSYLLLTSEKTDTKSIGRCISNLVADLKAEFPRPGLFIGATGMSVFITDAMDAAKSDVEKMDAIVLPLAFLVLAAVLQSVRLLILPLMGMLTSLVAALLLMRGVVKAGMDVTSAVPAIMASLQIAVSIDYSLFLLTRFQEEIAATKHEDRETSERVRSAVEGMLTHSGKTVVGSGLTLCSCFVALLFFPVQLMQSIGLGVLFAILIAILVNVSLTPALLLAFPRFFSADSTVFGRWQRRTRWRRSYLRGVCERYLCCFRRDEGMHFESRHLRERGLEMDLGSGGIRRGSQTERGKWNERKDGEAIPFWYRYGKLTTDSKCSLVALLVLLGLLIPAGITDVTLEKSSNMLLLVPRSGVARKTISRLQRVFPAGLTSPYQVLLLPAKATTAELQSTGGSAALGADGPVFSPGYWNASQVLLSRVNATLGDATITSPMWSNAARGAEFVNQVTLYMAETNRSLLFDFFYGNGSYCQSMQGPMRAQCQQVQVALKREAQRSVNHRLTAAFALVVTNMVWGSPKASRWTTRLRSLVEDFNGEQNEVRGYVAGEPVTMDDAVKAVYDDLPLVLIVTLVVVLAIMGAMYQSIIIPLRGLVTIALTLAVAFACAIGIYQHGWLDALPKDWHLEKDEALSWLNPAIAFCVILGLALDYDIFLVGRIVEFRARGFSDSEAIQLGVWKTGSVITAAGVIMAIAFSGLILSDIPMLNQVAVMLVTAVLLDTFVVRTIVVPTMMARLRSFNWFPGKVPAPGTLSAWEFVRMSNARNR